MANDNHASFAVIGFTVCIGIVAIVGVLVYLGGLCGEADKVLVETYSEKPVSGLSVGSPVNFRGVKLGEVKDISFVANHYPVEGAAGSYIYILMALDGKAFDDAKYGKVEREEVEADLQEWVRQRGLRATVTSTGVTGMSRVEMDFNVGEEFKVVPSIPWKPKYICVPPKDSLFESLSVSLSKVMNQIKKMDLNATWSNISTTVSSLAQATESARIMIEARQGELEQMMESMGETAEATRELMTELRHNPSLLIRGREYEPLRETER